MPVSGWDRETTIMHVAIKCYPEAAMKRKMVLSVFVLALSALFASCAGQPGQYYNTQTGAVVGAGTGALLGAAIGGSGTSTLLGLAAGTIMGGLVGNAVDQNNQAVREAAQYQRPVVYYDRNGQAVEAIPGAAVDQKPNCRKVTERTWQNGQIVSENVKEICTEGPPQTVVVQPQPQYAYPPPYPYPYYYPPYPYPYYYGPGVVLRFGGPHYGHRW